MGRAIAVRRDYTVGEVRRFAKEAKDVAQARRLLAIAAVLDGASRTGVAKIVGMDRQTLRDWAIRFNDHDRHAEPGQAHNCRSTYSVCPRSLITSLKTMSVIPARMTLSARAPVAIVHGVPNARKSGAGGVKSSRQ
jgi:transposase-like protein